ncbi:MAG: tRNA uridine-5-carboxymethylaminomethyl(34) synthesis enzyme MnmG, partial [Rhodothalassiaceae bacterium]
SGTDARFGVSRADGYLGVMIDDLVTRGVSEPYRMFTSRAEYRLHLRADNADQRLTEKGIACGAVSGARATRFRRRMAALAAARAALADCRISPDEAARHGVALNRDGRLRDGLELLAHPGIGLADLQRIWPERLARIAPDIAGQIAIEATYSRYLRRQEKDIEAFRKDESIAIPGDLDFTEVAGLSTEVREKFAAARPATLGAAGRIAGVTPAALTALLVHLRRRQRSAA